VVVVVVVRPDEPALLVVTPTGLPFPEVVDEHAPSRRHKARVTMAPRAIRLEGVALYDEGPSTS
jgi:hypothetical protein